MTVSWSALRLPLAFDDLRVEEEEFGNESERLRVDLLSFEAV